MRFEPGDWVWVHMRKKRFPEQRRSKLMPQGDGPFQIIERIIDNAYKVDLPGESTFNVTALFLFNIGDDSRSNPFEERGDDATSTPKDPLEILVGPVTRLKAKRFKEAFNGLLQDTWAKVDLIRSRQGQIRILI